MLIYIRSAQDQDNGKFQDGDGRNSKVPFLAQELFAVMAVENWCLFFFRAVDIGGVLVQTLIVCVHTGSTN